MKLVERPKTVQVRNCSEALSAKRCTPGQWVTDSAAAAVDGLLGNTARAIALLRKASDTGLPNYPLFREDPHFDLLRDRPEFLTLMAELKREWEGYRKEFGRH